MKTISKLKLGIPILLMLIESTSFSVLQAQNALSTLKGKLIDKATKEPLPFANVILLQSNKVITAAQTDFDGKYVLTAIPAGIYDLEAKYVGYPTVKKKGIVAIANKIIVIDFELSAGVELKAVVVESYKQPLIRLDNASSVGTISRESISRMPNRSSRKDKKYRNKEHLSGFNYYNTQQDVLANESYAGIVENEFYPLMWMLLPILT